MRIYCSRQRHEPFCCNVRPSVQIREHGWDGGRGGRGARRSVILISSTPRTYLNLSLLIIFYFPYVYPPAFSLTSSFLKYCAFVLSCTHRRVHPPALHWITLDLKSTLTRLRRWRRLLSFHSHSSSTWCWDMNQISLAHTNLLFFLGAPCFRALKILTFPTCNHCDSPSPLFSP